MEKILYKELSYEIQGAFYQVYKTFGNAFKESIYHKSLVEELKSRGLKVDNQKRIDVNYHAKKVGTYIPDLVVNDSIMIEIKCKPFLTRDDTRQFWQYLKGLPYKVGYLVNFGAPGKAQVVRRVYDTARRSRIFA